ncbi:MAG: DNA/RNA nuclease SfsA [Lentisphaeria bacterium]|nr:DNA/RNA nuclease SfsA [Lentisphaeria bacterium]
MKYHNTVPGKFIVRRNRFVAEVEIAGKTEVVHVKNTGRCKELLIPGVEVYLEKSLAPARKTRYDLIAVKKLRPGKAALLINMDSQIPNAAALEWLPKSGLFSPDAVFKREMTFGNSRFDIFVEDHARKVFIEVKGVTLEHNGVAMFPDAPTLRGVKHLHELADAVKAGYEACILFVIQMQEIHTFAPHDQMHKEFGDALRQAAGAGVKLLAMDCRIEPDSIELRQPVKIRL